MSQSRTSLLLLVAVLVATAFWARRTQAPVSLTPTSTVAPSGTASPDGAMPYMPRTVDADELHWVGFYEGSYGYGPRHSGGSHPVGKAGVKVDRPGKTVALVLTAYEPISWQVEVAPGSKVNTVILSGYYKQQLSGVGPKTLVFQSSYETPGPFHYFYAYRKDDKDNPFAESETMVRQLTGLKPASFQGAYAAEHVVDVTRKF